jgi:DNA-directed RNA polymerase specialized sigma subunit
MTMEEQKRVTVIEKVFRAELTMGEASLVLGVSERQCYRIKARVKEEGVKGATTQG